MKIGRNERCPCGSGLKYKKCCGRSSPSSSFPPAKDLYELNRLIAYEGEIGRRRCEFSEKMQVIVQDYNRDVMVRLMEAARSAGKTITCGPGCSYCCCQFIGVTLQQAEAIVFYLYKQGKDELDFFVRAYKDWRARMSKEPVFDETNRLAGETFGKFDELSARAFLEISEQYSQLNIPCPFLKNSRCMIYPVRPSPCASVAATSSPHHCEVRSGLQKELLIVTQQEVQDLPYFWGSRRSLIYSNAPLLVHEILHGGYPYLDSMPGVSGLYKAAASDFVVRGIIEQNMEVFRL